MPVVVSGAAVWPPFPNTTTSLRLRSTQFSPMNLPIIRFAGSTKTFSPSTSSHGARKLKKSYIRAMDSSSHSGGKYVRQDYLVRKVSAKELQEMIRGERSVPLVVDFYATWCGPCILMAQDLEMLAVEYENNAQIVKVDTDDEYEFARDMQVRGLPTLYFISPDQSKLAIRTEGLIPYMMMKNIIDNEM